MSYEHSFSIRTKCEGSPLVVITRFDETMDAWHTTTECDGKLVASLTNPALYMAAQTHLDMANKVRECYLESNQH